MYRGYWTPIDHNFKSYVKELNIKHEKYNGPKAECASLGFLQPLGQCAINIAFGTQDHVGKAKVTAIIVDKLPSEVAALIGQDANTQAGLKIDCAKGTIKIKENMHVNINYVHLKDEVKIPPRTSIRVQVNAAKRNEVKNGEYYVYTNNKTYTKTKAVIPNSLVRFDQGKTCVEISNFNDFPVKITQGSVVGAYEEVPPDHKIQCSSVVLNTLGNDSLQEQNVQPKEIKFIKNKEAKENF
mgnify:FL=1